MYHMTDNLYTPTDADTTHNGHSYVAQTIQSKHLSNLLRMSPSQ